MSAEPPYYDEAIDLAALRREYPTGRQYVETIHRMPADQLRELQEQRFLSAIARAWKVPFYDRHWRRHGMEPGDVSSLEDLARIPAYTVHDLRDAMGSRPPFADYIGLDPDKDPPMPLVLQTSGGTTGLPRPMLYSPRDREVFALLGARGSYMRGVRPFDLVQVTLSLGLANGGMQAREGIWKYTGAIPVMTGSGAQTPTRRQIEIMREWQVSHLQGFPAYLRHMAYVARDELALDVRDLKLKSIFTHLGVDSREDLQALWGAPVFDAYGTNECGAVAVDCGERSGMHIFEDAFILEVKDPDSLAVIPDGERGTMFITALFKELGPVIRFNTNDVSAIVPGICACGGTHRRLERMFGRSDNMLKLRGVNVFPEAIGAVVAAQAESNGEYVCVVSFGGEDRREELSVKVEARSAEVDKLMLASQLATRLKETLGIAVSIEVVDPKALDALTGVSTTTKAKRVIDRR
ncbi:MAG: phenylacetate--CoA ligase family protein [Burkholderiales bacterium]